MSAENLREALVEEIRDLYTAQAARLWQLSPARAEELLSELVQAGFLVRRDGQRYRLPSAV